MPLSECRELGAAWPEVEHAWETGAPDVGRRLRACAAIQRALPLLARGRGSDRDYVYYRRTQQLPSGEVLVLSRSAPPNAHKPEVRLRLRELDGVSVAVSVYEKESGRARERQRRTERQRQ